MNTEKVAEHMLSTGKFYSASLLAAELGISAVEASGKLFNIRNSKKYKCQVTELPGRKIRVLQIGGRKISNAALWNLAIFGKALSEVRA